MSKLSMSRQETVNALRNQYGESVAMAWEKANPEQRVAEPQVHTIAPPITFPVRIVLPWSMLVSDNEREKASAVRGKNGTVQPRKLLTPKYKAAREKIVEKARAAMVEDGYEFAPLDRAVSLYARVWVPDNRLHDVKNFSKGVEDALEKIVYTNDKWVWRSTWERAGVCVDAPRAEIEIAPI